MDRRFQIFISSTFRDLVDERAAILNAVLSIDGFPAGMELFPASNDTPWELITGVIDSSDYYVLVIAGRYGSTTAEGISYTEREYDYAIEAKKPVVAFLHADPFKRPGETIEMNEEAQERLGQFRKKIELNYTRNTWKTAEDLKSKVISSLVSEFKRHPAVGWVRANGIDDVELLKRNSDLHEEISQLRRELELLRGPRADSSTSERILAIADVMSAEEADLYLAFSSENGDPAALSKINQFTVQSLAAGYFIASTPGAPTTATASGWGLRDELIHRKILLYLLDQEKPSGRRVLFGKEIEGINAAPGEFATAFTVLRSRELLAINPKPDGHRTELTVRGRVIANRLRAYPSTEQTVSGTVDAI